MTIDVQSMGDRVYAVLRDRILSGELAHGERLHQEALSEELGVSRTPLREALGRLAADGLVELTPQRGARVAGVGPRDMHSSYESRLIVEPAAARLAAERAGGEPGCAAMLAAVAELRAASDAGDVRAAFVANRAFHLAVVEASGNAYLLRFAEMLWATRLGLAVYERQRGLSRFLAVDADSHEAIAVAIAGGDGDAAEALMREHIDGAMSLLLEQFAGAGGERAPVA
jgi:DNA-binding GntR family transcriptional regulator